MSIDATVCPMCATTVPSASVEEHINEHNPDMSHEQYDSNIRSIDKGKDYD